MQRCLASLIVWKNQLLQHCTEHEAAMKQYCMELDAATARQEQRLLGQAANSLQQRDAALAALHQVEEEVLQLKSALRVRSQLLLCGRNSAGRLSDNLCLLC